MSEHYAVLTGDLLKSGRLNPDELDQVRRRLREAVGDMEWQKGLVKGEAEFFRGDAWQALLTDPRYALRAAVYIRAALRSQHLADTRIAIGIGPVERIDPKRISLSTGRAFEASGHALDELRRFAMTLAVPASVGEVGAWAQVAVQLIDRLVGGWKPRQAETVRLALLMPEATHEEIGEHFDPAVTQQAVSKALDTAAWDAVEAAVTEFEASPFWQGK